MGRPLTKVGLSNRSRPVRYWTRVHTWDRGGPLSAEQLTKIAFVPPPRWLLLRRGMMPCAAARAGYGVGMLADASFDAELLPAELTALTV